MTVERNLLSAGVGSGATAIAYADSGAPYIHARRWSTGGGIGALYSDPTTYTGNYCWAVAFNPPGTVLMQCAFGSSPYAVAHRWSRAGGFGTPYSAPSSPALTTPVYNVAFSPSNDAVAFVGSTSGGTTPPVVVYRWTDSGGFGTRYSLPGTSLPGGADYVVSVSFSPAGDAIAYCFNASPYVYAFAWNSSTGFGTKYTNPATLPTGNGNSVAFSPAGDSIAIAHAVSPYITAYPWNSSTGFGTKYTNPATLPASTGYDISFNSNNTAVAVAVESGNCVVYPWSSSSGFGTAYSSPSGFTGTRTIAFSPN